MSRLSQILSYSAVIGFMASPLMASNGFYLLSDRPDDPGSKVRYVTDPAELYVNDSGYLKNGSEKHVLGWSVVDGAFVDPANWQANLRLVKLVESNDPLMATTHMSASFALPETAAIGDSHQHVWQAHDHEGVTRSIVAHLEKTAEASWNLYFSSESAAVIHHDHVAGQVLDETNRFQLNFTPEGTLMDVVMPWGGSGTPLNLWFSWNQAPDSPHHPADQNVMFDLGSVGMPASDPMATVIQGDSFEVRHEYQDGSGHKDIVWGHVGTDAVLYTDYSDGSTRPSYQIAYMRLTDQMTNPGAPMVEPALLDQDNLAKMQAAFALEDGS